MPNFTAVIRERANVYELPQTGPFIDAGAQVWDIRHPDFADGAPTDGVSNSRAAFAAAVATPGVRRIFVPAGTFVINGDAIDLLDNMEIVGAGRDHTTIIYTQPNDGVRRAPFRAIGRTGVRVSGMEIIHTGSRCVDRQRTAGRGGSTIHGYCVEMRDCFLYEVSHLRVREGLYGVYAHNSVDALASDQWSTNQGGFIFDIECIAQYNAGVYFTRGYACIVQSIRVEGCGYDGLKAPGRSRCCIVDGVVSRGNGRDGADFYDGYIEGIINNLMVTDNSAFGVELKGLPDPTLNDRVFRDTLVSNLVAIGNGVGGSWSNVSDPQPNVSITEIRNVAIVGLMTNGGTGEGVRITACQGITAVGWRLGRSAKQALSLHSTSRCVFEGEGLNPGYIEGVTPSAPGTHDAITLAVGSALNYFIGFGAGNSTGRPGAARYAVTADATSGSNVFVEFRSLSPLTGSFALAVSSVDLSGSVTMSAPFDVAGFFDSQIVVSYADGSHHGVQMLTASRPGVRLTGSNAEFGLQRLPAGGGGGVPESDLLLQVQAALVRIYTLQDVPLEFGTHGAGWVQIDHNGNWLPLTAAQQLGLAASPWQRGYFLGLWDNPVYFGSAALWIGPSGGLYLKSGTPLHDLDGTLLLPASLLGFSNIWLLSQIFSATAAFNSPSIPFTVVGTGQVNNLNANYLQGQLGAFYLALANATGTLPWAQVLKAGAVASDVGALSSTVLRTKMLLAAVALAASTTVLLPDLDLPVVAGETLKLMYEIPVTVSGGVAGVKPVLSGPAGVVVDYMYVQGTSNAATNTTQGALVTTALPITSSVGFVTASYTGWVRVNAVVTIGATPGTLSLGLVTGVSAAGSAGIQGHLVATKLG